MNGARLAARLRDSESPRLWTLASVACRVVGRFSRHRSRWSSRLGYTLERRDRARESRRESAADRHRLRGRGPAARQLRVARRLERRQDWAGAADAYRTVLRHDASPATVWYHLGKCLYAGGDLAGAAEALHTACDQDGSHPTWFDRLADVEQARGELPAAADARRQTVTLGGDDDPRWRLRLADLYDRVGQWADAQRVLQENVARHPGHAPSYHRLGDVSARLAHWGGTFTGTLAGRSSGGFRFDRDRARAAAVARQALERAAELEPAKTTWRAALAEARLADGDLAGAAAVYEAGLRDAAESTGRWVLSVKHRWQFALESIHHRLGQARVEDPLFECTAEPGPPVAVDTGQLAGLFSVRTTFSGLAVTGLVAAADVERVEILLDGQLIRSVNVGGDGFFPRFDLEIRRSTLASFPQQGELAVHTAAGVPLRAPGGAEQVRVTVPHGSGQLRDIIAGGGKLDKKGAISRSLTETRLRQERYLEIYAAVRDFFEKEFDRPLFLMYGTLLGYYREGDFIPGDDDFDAGYVSEKTDPVAVKEETKEIIVELIRAGFTVSFNRKGRLFRIQLEREATDGFHLDMRPVWFQNGRVWVHNHCSFPSSRERFLPVTEGDLRGVRVLVPRDSEAFLRGHYGPGWSTPDPGFMYYLSEIDPAILDNLDRALISVREYKELAARLRREVGDGPETGRLVSVGSQDLYPLEEFLA